MSYVPCVACNWGKSRFTGISRLQMNQRPGNSISTTQLNIKHSKHNKHLFERGNLADRQSIPVSWSRWRIAQMLGPNNNRNLSRAMNNENVIPPASPSITIRAQWTLRAGIVFVERLSGLWEGLGNTNRGVGYDWVEMPGTKHRVYG
ncbi:hypothetical protein BDFG_01592 [Blastomyces dermatitidis ATCC 26199]|nr:hypothetical protein BDFG_01592 [Blastomyces dermatitidis ATCC 26199]